MRRALPLLLFLALVGCKGSREKDVLGTWSTTAGQKATFTEDHKVRTMIGKINAEGTWSIKGNDVTFQPVSLNGSPVGELKAGLMKNPAAIPEQARKAVEDLDKPNVLTLSDDGKTLITNKTKDKTSGPGMTLTKS